MTPEFCCRPFTGIVIKAAHLHYLKLAIGDDGLFRCIRFPKLAKVYLLGPLARFENFGCSPSNVSLSHLPALKDLAVYGLPRLTLATVKLLESLHPNVVDYYQYNSTKRVSFSAVDGPAARDF